MAKRIKHGAQRPPLSVLDKLLYVLLVLGCLAAGFASMVYLGILLPDNIMHKDPHVLGGENKVAILGSMPFYLGVLTTMLPCLAGKQKRIPIFGNPSYKAKLFSPTVKVYPLFSGQYLQNFKEQERKPLRYFCIYLLVCAICFGILYPFCIYPREVCTDEGMYRSYNSFNHETHSAHISQAKQLRISITTGSRSGSRHISVTVVFEEESYVFYSGAKDPEEHLQAILALKNCFTKDQIILDNVDRIERLIWDQQYNAKESAMVYELFETQPD